MDTLSPIFAALADPTRRAILARLSEGETVVGDLARPFDMSLPAISRHLKVLENAGLIERRVEAQYRRCRLVPEGLRDAADWIEHYRQFWESQLDQLAKFLEETDPAAADAGTPAQTENENER